MKAFARLLERLAFTPARNAKLTILSHYFQTTPDPDRGYALAVLTGTLDLRQVSPSLLKRLASERVDEQLFRLSYDFVGDLAETIALIWPTDAEVSTEVSLSQAVLLLRETGKLSLPGVIADLLDRLTAPERLAFLKLATGNLRVGVSVRLAHTALAMGTLRGSEEIEEIWHGQAAPFLPLFTWLAGGPSPAPASAPFRPVMLSTPITAEELAPLDPTRHIAEWKWDGIRVQAVAEDGMRRLYSRTGEEIGAAFPDIIEAMTFEGAVDGELLVRRGAEIAPFADLQKRLGRKSVGRVLLQSHPAALILYDILAWRGEDLRPLPLSSRRARLEAAPFDSPRIGLSPLLPFETWEELARLRAAPHAPVIEGVMIKRLDTPYIAGRPRGPWFKWKRDPMVIDAVLLYAQSGHGKRSGFYSDFTFGLWEGEELVPVGKAYFGFTDEELRELDRFVRRNTVQRFGPVRQLAPKLVVEVAFEGLNVSQRHRSGVAMRFPRISRIRADKPAADADRLETLRAML
ncbi:cisplatin damage response ATP-dependent DNA ligase [Pleomorphomonas carboxyditropha]|uniref:DNA ligase (ATP) n=1 Tax=Pleomorphomonas carboxyditropha TaxID=2023338 RepID=A0A2G9X1F3_9HYPH|nr:cisplatin damage response ATP-dependent DNA ligase [Pleomorphomonas carboxyditropha]PIP00191.1 ATP-dependent DNA ligase [Pleomorphomonas carboxyditropha]